MGYFFGKHIHKSQDIPVGLISCTRGGSSAETWMGTESLRSLEYTHDALEIMKTTDMSFHEYRSRWNKEIKEWLDNNYPVSDEGMEQEWYAEDFHFQDWHDIEVPSSIESQEGLEDFNGVIWYKKTFVLPENLKNKNLFFRPGFINDMDETWLNGKKTGKTFNLTPWRPIE